jgi:hypothetical protein
MIPCAKTPLPATTPHHVLKPRTIQMMYYNKPVVGSVTNGRISPKGLLVLNPSRLTLPRISPLPLEESDGQSPPRHMAVVGSQLRAQRAAVKAFSPRMVRYMAGASRRLWTVCLVQRRWTPGWRAPTSLSTLVITLGERAAWCLV